MNILKISLLAILTLLFISCGDNEPEVMIDNPTTYSFARDGASSVSFDGQTTRIGMATELIDAMKDFDASIEQINEMFTNETASGGDANPFSDAALNESTKSVRSKVAASNDFFTTNTVEAASIKSTFDSWIEAQVNEVFPNETTEASAGVAGFSVDGTSTRYVNGKGLEYNQAVNKGLIGGLMVDQILNNYLSTAVLDAGDNIVQNDAGTVAEGKTYTNMEHKWDEAYGYLFGLASDKATPLATLGEDSFLNKYLKRVEDDADFAGIADEIYQAFKLGRAAIVAGDYDTRDKQADIIKEAISEIIGIRSVYYLQQGKNGIVQTGANGTVFHDLSEGYGFVYSLRFTRKSGSSDPYFTKSEVDGFIAQLDAGQGFWDVTPETLDDISEAIAANFDFTVAQAAE